jgi:PAS domain S-box-containing protein
LRQDDGALFIGHVDQTDLPDEPDELLKAEKVTALASIPIRTPNSLLGRLTIFSSHPILYSLRRRELLSLFASQAAFALSNALTYASADQELNLHADQLRRLEEINRQLTASSVSDNLYEIILDHAIEACSAEGGYLALYRSDTDRLQIVAYTSLRETKKRELGDLEFLPGEGIFGRAFETGQILNIPRASEDEQVRDPLDSKPVSILCVPVCGPETTLGVICVESALPHAFNQSHEQYLTQLAANAANALHHAQIYHELQARLTEQSLLYQASTQIAESLESDAVGLAVADSLRVTLRADMATIYEWDPVSQSLTQLARIKDGRPSSGPLPSIPEVNELLGHAQCIKDRTIMQWSSTEEVSRAEREYLKTNYGKGHLLLLPLSIGERTLGLVEIYRKEMVVFREAELRSAQSIAIQASIALDNTELFQKISESHNRLSAILNSTREGILLINTEGRISLANRQMEQLIGISTDDLQMQPLDNPDLDLGPRLGYLPQDLQNLVNALRQGHAQLAGTATYEGINDSGKTYFRIDAPVHDIADQLIGWLISIRDITEQKEVEDTREQLTEMIVHDLRSPLTAILNSILLIQRELDSQSTSSATKQALLVADRSVNQMLGLVNSLLDISRLESGKLKINPDNSQVRPLIMELQERFQLEANSIGIIMNAKYPDSDFEVSIDREKIQRVLANLLDNALKFTPVGGIVEIGFNQTTESGTFWVSDTGPGIPNEFQEKIFGRYMQVPGNAGRRRGTGLGLAFAKLAVEAHGGKIWVEENPAGGSIFKFSLPLERPQ